jgi:hypothetical protein
MIELDRRETEAGVVRVLEHGRCCRIAGDDDGPHGKGVTDVEIEPTAEDLARRNSLL